MDSNDIEELRSAFFGFFLCSICMFVFLLLLILIIDEINPELEKEIIQAKKECKAEEDYQERWERHGL